MSMAQVLASPRARATLVDASHDWPPTINLQSIFQKVYIYITSIDWWDFFGVGIEGFYEALTR